MCVVKVSKHNLLETKRSEHRRFVFLLNKEEMHAPLEIHLGATYELVRCFFSHSKLRREMTVKNTVFDS